MKVIDLYAYLPGKQLPAPGSGQIGPPGLHRLPPLPGYGFENYAHIFDGYQANFEGLDSDEPEHSHLEYLRTAQQSDELVREMDDAGVQLAGLEIAANAVTGEVLRRHPGRFIGFAYLSPFDGMRAVRELERLVREEGFGGLSVAALYDQLPASDRRYYPLYTKAAELDIPVQIYTAMTYANDRPYELGHPRHLDQVAIDFPELRLIAGLSGWPWITDMVGLLRRHPNLSCHTAGHRPRHFATPGSGWEQFLQFGNTLLKDRVMVGLSSVVLGLSMAEVIQEYLDLPLKDSVKEQWLYGNAARLLQVGR